MKPAYIAFFDLDGTILNTNSGKVLVRRAYEAGLMKKRELAYGIYLSLLNKFNFKDPVKIIEKMAKWVAGSPEKVLQELADDVFTRDLQRAVRSEISSEIIFHKGKNAEVVMLSSAIQSVCIPAARFLEMDDVISSKLEVRDGLYTGDPSGNFCFGEEKLIRLKEYCERRIYLPEDAYYYGDSISDLPVLAGVGYPVCVNPDKKLKRVAKRRGWDVRLWH